MENKEKQGEKVTVEGFISSISEPKKFDSGKEVVNLSIGVIDDNSKEKTYKNVQVWNDTSKHGSISDNAEWSFKKGDSVKVTGFENEYKDNKYISVDANSKEHSQISKVEKSTIEKITVKGNLASDITAKKVGENSVSNFSIAINKEGQEKADFVNVHVWDKDVKGNIKKNIYDLSTAKKGDYVEIVGYYKTYEINKDNPEKVQTATDLVGTEFKSISTSLGRKGTQEEKDEFLKKSISSGNYKEVEVALKAGADIKLAKSMDISSLSEKQQKAVKDVIAKTELFMEKKNNNANSVTM